MPGNNFRAIRPSDQEFSQRLQRLQQSLPERNLAGLVAFSSYMEREGNVLYLTNHRTVFPPWASDVVRNGAGYSAVLVLPQEGVTLFAPYRTDRDYLAQSVAEAVETLDFAGEIIRAMQRRLPGSGPLRIGLAGTDVMPTLIYRQLVANFPSVEWVAVDELLTSLRMVKSPFEQERLLQAAWVADQGIEAAFLATKAGITEKEVALAVHQACIRSGADHVVRIRMRAGGQVLEQGRWPMATENLLHEGDLIYMDLLGWVDNYVFDVARTWSVGPTSMEKEELLAKSEELLDETILALVSGRTGDEVVQAVGDLYKGTVWAPRYSPMGHGVGIECVENPWIMPKANIPLQPGMVFSLEPSFISPGFGKGQQEDMVLLTDAGPKRFSQAPRYLR